MASNRRSRRVPKASEGQIFLDFDSTGKERKLHTPHVFTQTQEAQPRDWVPVNSSRVAEARYDDGLTQIQVRFVDGTPWVYEDVPEEVWEMFITAPSKGRFINQTLDGYPYRRAYPDETDTW